MVPFEYCAMIFALGVAVGVVLAKTSPDYRSYTRYFEERQKALGKNPELVIDTWMQSPRPKKPLPE